MLIKLDIIGVPSDLGANIQGAALGPNALRKAGLHERIKELAINFCDYGDILIPAREDIKNYFAATAEYNYQLKKLVKNSCDLGHMPLVIGGDHALAIGSISGAAAHCYERDKKLHVIWIDAHADFNTPQSSPTGNIHGMGLAALLGQGHDMLIKHSKNYLCAHDITLIGIRDLDKLEKSRLEASGIRIFSMSDVDRRGIEWVMDQVLALSEQSFVHISFDIDALEPLIAPGVSTPVAGGLTFREARLLFEMAFASNKLASLDIAELNPLYDNCGQTTKICLDLIQSALGKTII